MNRLQVDPDRLGDRIGFRRFRHVTLAPQRLRQSTIEHTGSPGRSGGRRSRSPARWRRRCAARSPSTRRATSSACARRPRGPAGAGDRPRHARGARHATTCRTRRTRPARRRTRTSPAAATSSSTAATASGARRRPPHLRAGGVRRRPGDHQGRRLRPQRRPRLGRADQFGAARLQGPHLVRLQEERQGRDPQSAHAPDPRRAARRGHPELVHRRPRGGLRRVQPPDVPLQRPARRAARRLEGPLPQLRHRQARPGRRGLRHDPDDHERRLRRDHRQRRPDERRRLPQGEAAAARAAAGRLRDRRCSTPARARPRTH